MTINSNRRNDATGNDSLAVYPYGFKVFAATHIEVKVKKTSDGTITTLVYPTQFTVSNVGNRNGGNITLANVGGAWQNADGTLKTGYKISSRRLVSVLQATDIRNQGGFHADVHEDEFDYLTMIDLQQQDELDRSVKLDSAFETSAFNMTLPAPVAAGIIGFNSTGDGLAIISGLSGAATTAFTLSLLDDPNSLTARATLDAAQALNSLSAEASPALDDLLYMRDTSEGADNKITLANILKVLSAGLQFGGALIVNGKITRSVGGSALTIALKGSDGNDPSATNPVYVLMPTLTSNLFDGGYALRSVTAALSLVISSGSTLGHTNAVASAVYVYLIDNAGALELAASSKFFGGVSVQSSTAEGGAGASDTRTVLYSTAARANVATVCLQRWKSTQAAAGTWLLTTGEVQLYPFPYKTPTLTVVTATGNYTKPWDSMYLDVEVWGGGAGGGGSAGTAGGQNSAGTGGAAGGYVRKFIDSSIVPGTLAVTVGAAAGGGGAGAAGGAGNNSQWNDGTNNLVAGGGGAGAGGGATGNSQPTGPGGVPSTATGGDINIPGGGGCPGFTSPATNNPIGGKGGQSAKGTAPQYSPQDAAGTSGLIPGGGGGGAASSGAVGSQNGGPGARGEIDVTEHYAT